MNHELLRRVIADRNEVIQDAVIVPRNYTFEENANYVVTGIRRAGKSTLLYNRVRELIASGVKWQQIIYINFEDERLLEFSVEDFNDIVAVQSEMSGEKGYYFLDEVQNIRGWERFARRMADAGERVYITGSNAKMLSREVEAVLGGRYMSMTVYPYSFAEYLSASGRKLQGDYAYSTRQRGLISAGFEEYYIDGGFPEAVGFRNKRMYVQSVYNKVFLGDIVSRNSIRNDHAVNLLIKKIAETVRSDVSYTKLYNAVKAVGISCCKDSVIDYVGYAENAYLLFKLENYYAKFTDKESTPKYYFADNGVLNLFLVDKKAALLENVVASALFRTYGQAVCFLKSAKTGVDIDFYVPGEKLVIQVAYSISGEAREREINNIVRLSKAMDDGHRYLILTREETENISADGCTIEVIPAWQYLLRNVSGDVSH